MGASCSSAPLRKRSAHGSRHMSNASAASAEEASRNARNAQGNTNSSLNGNRSPATAEFPRHDSQMLDSSADGNNDRPFSMITGGGFIPKRLSSRGSAQSANTRAKVTNHQNSPKQSSPRGYALETFDFEAAALVCQRNSESMRTVAVGLVAGLPSSISPYDLQRLARDILNGGGNTKDDLGQLLRQETCLELIIPSRKSNVLLQDVQAAVALLGPSHALSFLVSRCEPTAVQFLLLKAVHWVDDTSLDSMSRTTALLLLTKTLSHYDENVPDLPFESQHMVVNSILRGYLVHEVRSESFLDALASVTSRGWCSPLLVWEWIQQQKKHVDLRVFRALITTITFSKERTLPRELLTNPDFVNLVLSGLKNIKPRGSLTAKLAFDLLVKVTEKTQSETFRTFCSLFQLFDDPNIHLLIEPLKAASILFERPMRSDSISGWVMGPEWLAVLLARALTCGNPDIAKLVIGRLLTFQWDLEVHNPLPEWFIIHYFLPCLEIEELYSPSMYESTGAFKIQPTSFVTGKFKKIQEREDAKTELQGFNLPDGLLQFFLVHLRASSDIQGMAIRIFQGICDLQALSAIFVSVESLTRALNEIWSDPGLPRPALGEEMFQVLTHILGKHGMAGATVKRTVMLIGCLLDFALRQTTSTDWRRVVRLCLGAPDYFLKHESLILLNRESKQNLLQSLGSFLKPLGEETMKTALLNDALGRDLRFSEQWGLVCASLQSVGVTINLDNDEELIRKQGDDGARRWLLLVLTWVRLTDKQMLEKQNCPKLLRVVSDYALDYCSKALDFPSSPELLEEAWVGVGGLYRASVSEKRESLAYLSLNLLALTDACTCDADAFKDLTAKAVDRVIKRYADSGLIDLRALVVAAVCLSSRLTSNPSLDEDTLSSLIKTINAIDRTGRVDNADKWVLPSERRNIVTSSTLWGEFTERKWQVFNAIVHHVNPEARDIIVNLARRELAENRDAKEPNLVLALVECLKHYDAMDEDFASELLDCVVASKSVVAFDAFIDHWFGQRAFESKSSHVKYLLRRVADPDRTVPHEAFVKRLSARLFFRSCLCAKPELAKGMEDEIMTLLQRNDKVGEVVDYAAGLASRSVVIMREELFICRATHTVHPSALVRFACLAWIDSCLNAWEALSEEGRKFFHSLALRVLNDLVNLKSRLAALKSSFHEFHSRYLSIALLVLARAFQFEDCANAGAAIIGACAGGSLTADVKQNLEKVLVHLIVMDWRRILPSIEKQLHQNANGWLVMSLMSCASVAWHRLCDLGEKGSYENELDSRMLDLALPWITCSKSSIRVLAANICLNVKARKRDGRLMANKGSDMAVALKALSHLESNTQMKRLMDRITRDQRNNSNLDINLDLVSLLETSEFNLLGDLCPRDLRIDRIADLVRAEQEDFFAGLEASMMIENTSRGEVASSEEQSSLHTPPPQLFFQKKIDTSQKEPGELGSARQSLVIVASFVDKIPNLAGLARTCEVFKARTLVLADASVINDGEFKSISRTAEQWLPIVEVKPSQVAEYVMKLRRDESFLLVGLEQTTSSVALQEMEWPSHGRVCIVLGAEGTGVPPEVLALLDATIEIPQFGLVKSLNVHVSGALCVWAYTEAMIALGTS